MESLIKIDTKIAFGCFEPGDGTRYEIAFAMMTPEQIRIWHGSPENEVVMFRFGLVAGSQTRFVDLGVSYSLEHFIDGFYGDSVQGFHSFWRQAAAYLTFCKLFGMSPRTDHEGNMEFLNSILGVWNKSTNKWKEQLKDLGALGYIDLYASKYTEKVPSAHTVNSVSHKGVG